jgi:predicted dehydrogenase
MKNIRWGIIGCGDVTEVKSGPGFQKARGSELVAVMRRNGDLAKDYALRHNVPQWYDDAEALINDQNVDAVYIATPPSTHKNYTLQAANAGKPVLVEKPMAMTYVECLEMLNVCNQSSIPLFTSYYRRALPRFLKIKSMLDKSAIGTVEKVSIRYERLPKESDITGKENWRTNPSIAGEGYFFDLACHMLDLIQFFIAPIESANGSSINRLHLYPIDDSFTALFRFANGVQGVGTWNFASSDTIEETEINGSKGNIIFSTFHDDPIIIKTNTGIEKLIIEHPDHVHQPLIQTIVDELHGVGMCHSTGLTGAQTSWVMDKILGRII